MKTTKLVLLTIIALAGLNSCHNSKSASTDKTHHWHNTTPEERKANQSK
ncbi:MAG: hypothetical protein JWO06_209 [Bacteroidota bacterium]|nr:hypothetical protein [Bacteroidota bacterium]